MFSALTEFWIAARRAQTATIEATTRPGMFRGSLQGAQAAAAEASNDNHGTLQEERATGRMAPGDRHGRQWDRLLSLMPGEASASPGSRPPGDNPGVPVIPQDDAARAADRTGESATRKAERAGNHRRTTQVIFAREFVMAPPDEVMRQVREGVYFLRAWRDYRQFSQDDVADLFGKTRDAVNWHEHGYSRPSLQTLARFAEIFDCPVEQLTPRPGSNLQPWLTVICAPDVPGKLEPRSPDDTDYPDAVLGHMLSGKSPLTAWRLHRGLSIAQLADAYGTSPGNVKHLEQSIFLRRRTIERLCPILRCKAAQLLRPASLPGDPAGKRHAIPDTTPPEFRFAQAST
jgi:transcriptional regulator with XRE-family HTH domain